jgi:RNA polymerase sigma-70 factor (ECF subfamily)
MTHPSAPPANSVDFRELFETYRPFVTRTLRRQGVRTADLHDLCQEVFVIIHRKLQEFDGRASVRSWIYGICSRVASAYRRSARFRLEETRARCPEPPDGTTQDEDFERCQARARAQAVLASLAEDKLAIFVLYEIEGRTMTEVADAVGCPLQTAYSRLHAARRALKTLLDGTDIV